MERKEISIPKGTKATMWQEGDKIIVEYENVKEEPEFRNGQFLTLSDYGGRWIIILKSIEHRRINPIEYHAMLGINNQIRLNSICDFGNWCKSTEAEKQELLDALHKEGKDWDAEKLQIIDYVWKPKIGETYFQPSIYYDPLFIEAIWDNDISEDKWFKRGLVFKTQEQAIACAKKMLESLKTR